MNEQTLLVRTDDGLKLVVDVFGDGPPLVAAHGLTGNRHIMRRQFRVLADRYRLVVYDQRGHGDSSPVTDPALYNPYLMAEDMRAVMDTLEIEQAVVEGESMGAATTLLFALKYPQRVKALMLTGPAFGDQLNPDVSSLNQMARDLEQYGKDEYMQLVEKRMREEWNAPDEVVEAVKFMQAPHQEASIIVALDTVKNWVLFQDISVIRALTMPVCIIGWPDDPLHPIDLARRMAHIFPQAQLETIPSVGHVFVNQGAVIGEIYARFLSQLAEHPN